MSKNKNPILEYFKTFDTIPGHSSYPPQLKYTFANRDWAVFDAEAQSRKAVRIPSCYDEIELNIPRLKVDTRSSYPIGDLMNRNISHLFSKNLPQETDHFPPNFREPPPLNLPRIPNPSYPLQKKSQTVASNSKGSRLQAERTIVEREMPQFAFVKQGNSSAFVGWQKTTTGGKKFYLKLVIPRYYPDEMPSLYVTSPQTLRKRGSGTINAMGPVHDFHTGTNGPKGCVQICHFTQDFWNASKTCVAVLIKGILWLEAYSVHLLTGMTIAEILEQWERRQK